MTVIEFAKQLIELYDKCEDLNKEVASYKIQLILTFYKIEETPFSFAEWLTVHNHFNVKIMDNKLIFDMPQGQAINSLDEFFTSVYNKLHMKHYRVVTIDGKQVFNRIN